MSRLFRRGPGLFSFQFFLRNLSYMLIFYSRIVGWVELSKPLGVNLADKSCHTL